MAEEFRGMPCRSVGNSGLFVSVVGLGMWKWGDPAYDGSRIGDHEGFEVLDRALELGVFHWIRHVPTTWHREIPNACWGVISPPVHGRSGSRWSWRPRSTIRCAGARHGGRFYAQSARRLTDVHPLGVDRCLERMQTDYIDLLYLHQNGVDDEGNYRVPIEETWGAFDDLVTQGKVRYLAVSNHSAKQMANVVATLEKVGKDVSRRIVAVQNGTISCSRTRSRPRRAAGRLTSWRPRPGPTWA